MGFRIAVRVSGSKPRTSPENEPSAPRSTDLTNTRPTADEAEILNLWNMEGLTGVCFTPREVVDFVDRVRCLVR
jgi:hypothetical protein